MQSVPGCDNGTRKKKPVNTLNFSSFPALRSWYPEPAGTFNLMFQPLQKFWVSMAMGQGLLALGWPG